MNKPGLLIAALAAAICWTACTKSDDGPQRPVDSRECKLQYVHNKNSVDSFFYDDQFRLTRIRVGSQELIYDYTIFGRITINKKIYGFAAGKNVLTLDSAKRVTRIRIEEDIQGTDWSQYDYEYSGDHVARELKTTSGGSSDTVVYNWSTGNVTAHSSAAGPLNYNYYLDKNWEHGDFANYHLLTTIGVNLFQTKNLVKDFRSFTGITYAYDSLGRLNQASVNGEAYSYQYLCR